MWIILGGIATVILGILGLIRWWLLFLKALAALIPFMLVVGGAFAIIIGISSIKDRKEEEEREEADEQSTKRDES